MIGKKWLFCLKLSKGSSELEYLNFQFIYDIFVHDNDLNMFFFFSSLYFHDFAAKCLILLFVMKFSDYEI